MTVSREAFDFGAFWSKGLRMGTRQCNVKAHNRQLSNLIELGKAKPSFIVSQSRMSCRWKKRNRPGITRADAYDRFASLKNS